MAQSFAKRFQEKPAIATPQSTLEPAGQAAAQIAELFYWMGAGAVVIWTVVVGTAVYSIYRPRRHHPTTTKWLVIGGGALFPTIVLTGLLCVSLPMLPELHRPAAEGSLQVHVDGALWWWRVEYERGTPEAVVSANEIRLPVGREVEFKLNSEDVIHSFWIPALGGKVDMIPGRQTRLRLLPTRIGEFRGVCAEFCGAAHAQMNFDVIVMPAEQFDAWLDEQRRPASEPQSSDGIAGRQLFLRHGCGGCHAIHGTEAVGRVGPDLTHFGSRRSIAAGVLVNNPDNLVRWIKEPDRVKPGAEMPAFHALTPIQTQKIASYLGTLE